MSHPRMTNLTYSEWEMADYIPVRLVLQVLHVPRVCVLLHVSDWIHASIITVMVQKTQQFSGAKNSSFPDACYGKHFHRLQGLCLYF